MERHPERLHRATQALGDLFVEERQETRSSLHERDGDAHRREHRRVLAPDDASTHDDQAPREAVDLQDRVRVVDVFVIEGNVRRMMRP